MGGERARTGPRRGPGRTASGRNASGGPRARSGRGCGPAERAQKGATAIPRIRGRHQQRRRRAPSADAPGIVARQGRDAMRPGARSAQSPVAQRAAAMREQAHSGRRRPGRRRARGTKGASRRRPLRQATGVPRGRPANARPLAAPRGAVSARSPGPRPLASRSREAPRSCSRAAADPPQSMPLLPSRPIFTPNTTPIRVSGLFVVPSAFLPPQT